MTTIEAKALTWYSREYELRPQLSAFPIVTFKDRDGNKITRNLDAIVDEYKPAHEEELKQRARERRQAKAANERRR